MFVFPFFAKPKVVSNFGTSYFQFADAAGRTMVAVHVDHIFLCIREAGCVENWVTSLFPCLRMSVLLKAMPLEMSLNLCAGLPGRVPD